MLAIIGKSPTITFNLIDSDILYHTFSRDCKKCFEKEFLNLLLLANENFTVIYIQCIIFLFRRTDIGRSQNISYFQVLPTLYR